jgi:hypothetical protein
MPVTGKTVHIPCGGLGGFRHIRRYLDSDKGSGVRDTALLLMEIVDLFYSLSDNSPNHESSALNDPTAVKLMVAMLSDTTGTGIVHAAYDRLAHLTARPQLIRQGALLSRAITVSRLRPRQKRHLLLLAGVDRAAATRIVDLDRATLAERARLGERLAEDSLIAAYDGATSYRTKVKLVEALGYCGTQRCLAHLIRRFNEPAYDLRGTNSCVHESIRYPILKTLVPYHPDAGILNADLRSLEPYGLDEPEAVSVYLGRFLEWAEKEYGVQPSDPSPPDAILRGACHPDPDRPGEYR